MHAILTGMAEANAQQIAIDVEASKVSALLDEPEHARACYVLAHGAGVGIYHSFMAAVAQGLAERGIATLRYNFPYMEQRRGRPDSPKVAQAAVRAAVNEASRALPGVPLFAGGKSYGGRMTSQAQAETALANVRGLIFLGFPLHPPGKPSNDRADHLSSVKLPMLFLQGTRDEFAESAFLRPLIKRLGARATLKEFDGADHSFHVGAKTGRTDAQVMTELLNATATWIDGVIG